MRKRVPVWLGVTCLVVGLTTLASACQVSKSSPDPATQAACQSSGPALAADIPEDLKLTGTLELPQSGFPPSPQIALYRNVRGSEFAVMDYGSVSAAEALPGRTDGIEGEPQSAGGLLFELGPSGPNGIEGYLFEQPDSLSLLLSRQFVALGEPSELFAAVDRNLGEFTRVSYQTVSHLPGVGVLPVSPHAVGSLVSYTARYNTGDQRAVVISRVSYCDDIEPLEMFEWWYGEDASMRDGELVVRGPAPAGNGNFVIRFTTSDGLTVVGTLGLRDSETAAAIERVKTASASEWSDALAQAPNEAGG